MTLQEIQYKAQAIMQKWRDEDSAPYIEFVEELALMTVPEEPELVRHPPIGYTYPSDASRDEQLKMALLALLTSDLIKVAGNKFTKQDLIDWVEKQKEQKPVETSDFKTKLAEYLQNNSPKDGQYVISSESILEMAKEELIKRGELQKPAEWSEEEKRKLNRIYKILGYAADDKGFLKSKRIIGDKEAIELQDFLKSLRSSWKPSEVCYGAKGDPDPAGVWKPSEEQMEALERTIRLANFGLEKNRRKALESLYEQLKNL